MRASIHRAKALAPGCEHEPSADCPKLTQSRSATSTPLHTPVVCRRAVVDGRRPPASRLGLFQRSRLAPTHYRPTPTGDSRRLLPGCRTLTLDTQCIAPVNARSIASPDRPVFRWCLVDTGRHRGVGASVRSRCRRPHKQPHSRSPVRPASARHEEDAESSPCDPVTRRIAPRNQLQQYGPLRAAHPGVDATRLHTRGPSGRPGQHHCPTDSRRDPP